MSTWNTRQLYQWLNFVQFRLLPACCVLCGRPAGRDLDLCRSCEASLPRLPPGCPRCARPLEGSLPCLLCPAAAAGLARTLAAHPYREPIATLVTRFKYQQDLAAGRVLAEGLAAQLRAHYQDAAWPELLLPVPLHPSRWRERGYNQAALIAGDLGRLLGLPVASRLLERVRITPPQQGLQAAERRRNLDGAFALADGPLPARLSRVALVDDVVTTRSTAQALAEVLHARWPVLEVQLWCLARA